MSKRVIKVVANDRQRGMRLNIRADVVMPNGSLTPDEQARLKSILADALVTATRSVPYADYNSLNTRVS